MFKKTMSFALLATIPFILCLCTKQPLKTIELKHLALDNLEGVITLSNVEIDKQIFSEGTGSLKVTASESTTVWLFEFNDLDIDDARLVYQAKIRCNDLEGRAYLEMCCHFPDKGDFFSRGCKIHLPAL
jgi:hypothetical protein